MMVHLARRCIGSMVLLLLVCASVGSVAAQGTATPAPTQGNSQYTGKVSKISPFTVNSNGQDRVVNPAPNTVVTRDGKTAQLADLKVGDQVNVTANPDGTAARVEQVKEGGIPGWLIPLILALLLIGLLAYFLSRRKDTFVLQKNDTSAPRR